jgi:hypothetical protein
MITVPNLRRPASAWTFLNDAIRALTQPPADAALCDRRVEALARDSRIGRALSGLSVAWSRAARDSAVVRACRRHVMPLANGSIVDRVRAVGVVVAVASATTLILRTLSTENDPFSWMLPALAGAVALAAIAAANAIARAIAHYRT